MSSPARLPGASLNTRYLNIYATDAREVIELWIEDAQKASEPIIQPTFAA